MEFHDNDHVYSVIPEVLGIKEEYDGYLAGLAAHEEDPDNYPKPEEVKPVICHLRPISSDAHAKSILYQQDIHANYTREKALELVKEDAYKLIDERCTIENLKCGGRLITTLPEARKHAPRSLVDWISGMIHSDKDLMRCEIKN